MWNAFGEGENATDEQVQGGKRNTVPETAAHRWYVNCAFLVPAHVTIWRCTWEQSNTCLHTQAHSRSQLWNWSASPAWAAKHLQAAR